MNSAAPFAAPRGAGREDAVLAAARRFAAATGVGLSHSEHVTTLALALFDQLAELHGLGRRERLWLACAGVLHDIGWAHGRKGHHKEALQVILQDRGLPLSRRARAIVANVARYHRKALPCPEHVHYAGLCKEDRRTVAVLGGLLRVADGLDYRHRSNIQAVRVEADDRQIVLTCAVSAAARPEFLRGQEKGDLLAKVLGRKLLVCGSRKRTAAGRSTLPPSSSPGDRGRADHGKGTA